MNTNKHNVNHRKNEKRLFFSILKKFRPDGKDGPEF